MGNTLANTSPGPSIGRFKQTNQLTKFIQSALSDDQAKQRVCCLGPGNNLITMALPYIDKNSNIQSGVIMFDVFNNDTYLKDGSCTIKDIEYPSPDGNNNNNGYIYYGPTNSCYSFYTNFCTNAQTLQNSTLYEVDVNGPVYGYIIPDPNNTGAVLANNFGDCNCQNSSLGSQIKTGTGTSTPAIDIIYTIDATCAQELQSNFKTMTVPQVNLCINSNQMQQVNAKTGANIKVSQVMTCGNGNNNSNAQALSSSTTITSPDNPVNPVNPANIGNISNLLNPYNQLNPSSSSNQLNPSSSSNPSNPYNPSNPSSSSNPSNPSSSSNPSTKNNNTETIVIIITIVIILLSVGGFFILKKK